MAGRRSSVSPKTRDKPNPSQRKTWANGELTGRKIRFRPRGPNWAKRKGKTLAEESYASLSLPHFLGGWGGGMYKYFIQRPPPPPRSSVIRLVFYAHYTPGGYKKAATMTLVSHGTNSRYAGLRSPLPYRLIVSINRSMTSRLSVFRPGPVLGFPL